MKLKAQLIEVISRTENVKSFRFKLEEKLGFIPGQFVKVIFDIEDNKNKQLNKFLSISNGIGKEYIEVTKKLSESRFSDKLRSLRKGDSIYIEGPLGKCVCDPDKKKFLFLAGGIGITPVISIIESLAQENTDADIVLIYSNWKFSEIAFFQELTKLEHEIDNLKIIHVLAENDQGSTYFSGFINKDIIKNNILDYLERQVFIFGPPAMVNAVKTECLDINCQKDMLKSENFIGY